MNFIVLDCVWITGTHIHYSGEFSDTNSMKKWLEIYLSMHPVLGKESVTPDLLQQWYKDYLQANVVSSNSRCPPSPPCKSFISLFNQLVEERSHLTDPRRTHFFSHTYLESWKCLEKSSGCSHCENLTESAHSWPSLSAILDFCRMRVGM